MPGSNHSGTPFAMLCPNGPGGQIQPSLLFGKRSSSPGAGIKEFRDEFVRSPQVQEPHETDNDDSGSGD